MKTSTKFILGATVILLAVAFGFMLAMYLTKPKIISNPIPVYIKGKDSTVVNNFYYFIKDTSKAEVANDTARTKFYAEKIFDKDTIKSSTHISYSILDSSFAIDQYFDYVKTKEFRVDTIKTEVPYHVEVEKDLMFYENPYFNFIAGIISAVIIFFLSGG